MTYLLEHWKPVVGYGGYYEISNVGSVRRIKMTDGRAVYYPLHPSLGGTALYQKVNLQNGDRVYTRSVHKLVAEAFVGKCPTGHTVHHKNEYKLKNWASNLEYLTRAENIRLSYINGTTRRGDKHCRSILVEADIRHIRALAAELRPYEIASRFGLDTSHVAKIIGRKLWKHIT